MCAAPENSMSLIERLGPLLGRILIGLLFIPSGLSKMGNLTGTAGYIASKGLPAPSALAVLTVIVEVLVGIALVIGWKARWAALILCVFSIVSAFLFHNFWAAPQAEQMGQMINFYKNLAIAGGLLFVAAFGPGPLSVDSRQPV
jgi:putative oxidoreductase